MEWIGLGLVLLVAGSLAGATMAVICGVTDRFHCEFSDSRLKS